MSNGKRGPAAFKGVVVGARQQCSRLGGKQSGLHTIAAGHQGSVHVRLSYDKETELEMAAVTLEPWNGEGRTQLLYDGPIRGRYVSDVRRHLVRTLLAERLRLSADIVTSLTDELLALL